MNKWINGKYMRMHTYNFQWESGKAISTIQEKAKMNLYSFRWMIFSDVLHLTLLILHAFLFHSNASFVCVCWFFFFVFIRVCSYKCYAIICKKCISFPYYMYVQICIYWIRALLYIFALAVYTYISISAHRNELI